MFIFFPNCYLCYFKISLDSLCNVQAQLSSMILFWGGGLGLLSSGEALVSVGACACVCGVKYCMNMKIAPINRLYFKFWETLISTPPWHMNLISTSPRRILSATLALSCFPYFLFFCRCFFSLFIHLVCYPTFSLLLSKFCCHIHISETLSLSFCCHEWVAQRSHKYNSDAPATNAKWEKVGNQSTFTF